MFGVSNSLVVFFLLLNYREHFAEGSTELVILDHIHYQSDDTERLATPVLPNVLRLQFKAHGHFVQLQLVKNSHISTITPFCMYENNKTICLTDDHTNQSYELYHDPDNNAAMSVEIDRTTHDGSLFKLNGEYMRGNELFEINSANVLLRRLTRKNYHSIKRRSVSSTPKFQVKVPGVINNSKKSHYGVELLIIIDYSIYDKFMQRSNNSILECNKKIRYYFAHIANAIDLRFSSIKAPDFNVYVRLSGYYILKDSSSTPFLTNSRTSTQKGYKLDGLSALNGLKEFLQQRKDQPSYDHAMLFTDYDTFNTESRILGSTYASGICSHSQISLIVDHGAYTSAGTAAHELAHNLGVTYHDGDGDAKGCSSDMHYIMSPSVGVLNSSTKEYGFKFSICSVAQLREKLKEMDSNNKNCLANIASTENPIEFLNYMEVLPGQIENVHDQCRQIYGPDSFMCPPNHPSEICYKMLCYIPSTKRCVAKSEQKAAIGTPCGNKKWCFLGNCVGNSTASTVTDDCPYPDLPKLVDCSQASPLICKNKDFYKRCCASCNKNFTAQETCKDVPILILSRYTCPQFLKAHGTIQCQNDPNIQQYCCASCKDFKNQTLVDPSSTSPFSSNCTDRSDIKLNGVDCPQFISMYGTEMCKRNMVQTNCCASCT